MTRSTKTRSTKTRSTKTRSTKTPSKPAAGTARRPAKRRGAEPGSSETHERILQAAIPLFSLYGYRRTSVDLLAAEAGVAKPTLYSYFADKEALFRAVVERVLKDLLDEAERAASASGSLEERVTGVLAAKFTRLFELVHRSPHAAELLGSQASLAEGAEERADRAFARILGRVLDEGIAGGELDPARADLSQGALASVLLRCGHGAGYCASGAAAHRRQLGEMVRAVLAGVRVPGARARSSR